MEKLDPIYFAGDVAHGHGLRTGWMNLQVSHGGGIFFLCIPHQPWREGDSSSSSCGLCIRNLVIQLEGVLTLTSHYQCCGWPPSLLVGDCQLSKALFSVYWPTLLSPRFLVCPSLQSACPTP
jgi:hypothetical protein